MSPRPRPHQPRLRARLGPFELAAHLGDEVALHADAEGRWITFRRGDAGPFRRTLGGEVVRRAPGGDLRGVPDPDAVHGAVCAAATELRAQAASLPGAERALRGGDLDDLDRRLAEVAAWTPERHTAEPARFAEAYPESVPILPPDRYRDVVVLPALGCPSNACTFCAFYRGAGFQVLDRAAFRAHLARVGALLGRGLGRRDGVFLGSASALSLSQRRVLDVLAEVAGWLGSPPRRGVGAFLDPDHAPARGAAEYAELAAAGLAQATLGLETGLPALRAELGKHPELAGMEAACRGLGAAGVRRAITILVGAGGAPRRRAHREATAAAVARLDLGPGDLVYLSPLQGALAPDAMEAEVEALRRAVAAATPAKPTPYRVDLYRYYA